MQDDEASARPRPHGLRLVWSRPEGGAAPARAPLPPEPTAPPGRRPRPPLAWRVDFALAVERHLAGADGLSREQFLRTYALGILG